MSQDVRVKFNVPLAQTVDADFERRAELDAFGQLHMTQNTNRSDTFAS